MGMQHRSRCSCPWVGLRPSRSKKTSCGGLLAGLAASCVYWQDAGAAQVRVS